MCLTYIRLSYARTSLPTSENRVEKYVQKMRITLENLYLFMRMVRKKITHEKHAENTCYNKRKSCEKKTVTANENHARMAIFTNENRALSMHITYVK